MSSANKVQKTTMAWLIECSRLINTSKMMLKALTRSIISLRRNLNSLLEGQAVEFPEKKVTIHNQKQAVEYLKPQKASKDLTSERRSKLNERINKLGKSAGRNRPMNWSQWTLMKKTHRTTLDPLSEGRRRRLQKTIGATTNSEKIPSMTAIAEMVASIQQGWRRTMNWKPLH